GAATPGTCAVYTTTAKSKLIVRLFMGPVAADAYQAAQWGPPLQPQNTDTWAAGVKPAADGTGIIVTNANGTAACQALTSDTNNEVITDKTTLYHLLANICRPVLIKAAG